ncbi:MAG: hypothetical protein JSV68_07500 [Anaerolineaceae bacterium]|nr:MAG: hypothetical protein JSV68_07500 [Anaerolineaceae bacterium]
MDDETNLVTSAQETDFNRGALEFEIFTQEHWPDSELARDKGYHDCGMSFPISNYLPPF